MRRTQLLAASCLLCSLLGLAAAMPATVAAQDDLQGIVPYIMLVVDTSGSMERQAGCTCTSASCNECLPQCNLSNDPMTGAVDPRKMNRWAVTLEALTGSFENFDCDPIIRSEEHGMSYDKAYPIPYHQPWRCGGTSGVPCAYNSTQSTLRQQSNGILDLNVSGIRFGLMTFDGVGSYDRDQQRSLVEFDDGRSEGIEGMWSYAGKKVYRYPGCPHEYVMDTGSRSNLAVEGALISLESCSGPGPRGTPGCEDWCAACPGTQDTVNRDIQESLLATRPYGGTPIAAALDDLYYHFKEDLSDEFQSCRDRFAILITDGRPDDDYRNVNCDCNEPGSGKSCADFLNATERPEDMRCPYPRPEQVALDLVEGRGSDTPPLERLYVLGLAVSNDAVAREKIEKMAENGCTDTDENCEIRCTDTPANCAAKERSPAIFADNLNDLRTAVQVIVDDQNHAVSRTVPVFALTDNPQQPQLMFTSGLQLPTQANQPWHGILERHRYVCSSGGSGGTTPSSAREVPLIQEDLFHESLNTQSGRKILTAYPQSLGVNRDGVLAKQTGMCDTVGCNMVELGSQSPSQLQVLLGAATASEATEIVDWMYAKSTTPRDDAALGAIYHSTPAIAGAPRFDTTDPAFNAFRRQPRIAGRPQILYVGTTDGLLHAIATDDFDNPSISGWTNLREGQELWAFVPPMLLNDLKTNLTTQQYLMDATPVIRTVNLNRAANSGAGDYRTILTMGMREGGNAYFALDVTDPFNPRFLWQVAGGTIGKTYGQPAVVQSRFVVGGVSQPKEGAIAILPGGVGRRATGGDSCDGGSTKSYRTAGGSVFTTKVPQPSGNPDTANHRFDVRCWEAVGRSLAFVDVETGVLLKEIYLSSSARTNWSQNPPAVTTSEKPFFPSPLVSAPSPFPDEIGTVASRAYITDADGVIWRIDMSNPDPNPSRPDAGWTARPFHDIFWDKNFAEGELSYEGPILSVDSAGRPVVIAGTGDTSNFYKTTIENRIVSLTEVQIGTATTPVYEANLNWELRVKPGTVDTKHTDGTSVRVDGLGPSELVTGSMALFDGQLFAGTFIAVANTDDVCDKGRGRLLALHYNEADYDNDRNATAGNVVTYGPMRINAGRLNPTTSIVNLLRSDPRGDNVKISGISLVQIPSCADTTATFQDPWHDAWSGVNNLTPPDLRMIAHADNDNNDPSDTVDQRGGSALSTVNQQLAPPVRSTEVISWAASAD